MVWPVEREYVSKAEKGLGVRFPDVYIDRIVRRNGGSVAALEDVWTIHPVCDESDRKRMIRTANDVVRETKSVRQMYNSFPRDGVAIAECNGDRLVLLPSEGEAGQLGETVYVWRREGELELVAELDALWPGG